MSAHLNIAQYAHQIAIYKKNFSDVRTFSMAVFSRWMKRIS